ncbi:MAG: SDR family oxidoreductase [Cryobacterium sp.]|nr:SDR family oxidoreductase [Cryobacterium sp.]
MPRTGSNPQDFLQLGGRRLLITGASSGIGRSVAVLAARHGARVALVARRGDELDLVLSELHGEGHLAVPFDVTEFDAIPDMIDEVVSEVGLLDGLVHAAGIHRAAALRQATPQHVEELIGVNLTAPLMLTRAFRRPHVRGADPSVVFISSAASMVGEPGVSGYSASKGALNSLSRSLAVELNREGIRCNTIAAGVVQTPLTQGLREMVGEAAWGEIASAHPLGIGEASDVAHAVLFLLSPASRWMLGATVAVDGGYTSR